MGKNDQFVQSGMLDLTEITIDKLLDGIGSIDAMERSVLRDVDSPSRSIGGSNGS